jgi:hypothetical protein
MLRESGNELNFQFRYAEGVAICLKLECSVESVIHDGGLNNLPSY